MQNKLNFVWRMRPIEKVYLIGGYDTTGEPSQSGASQETVEAEVDRCFQTYGTHSNYVFFGFLLEDSLDAEQRQRRLAPLVKAALKYQ